jgi:hypothetical protein
MIEDIERFDPYDSLVSLMEDMGFLQPYVCSVDISSVKGVALCDVVVSRGIKNIVRRVVINNSAGRSAWASGANGDWDYMQTECPIIGWCITSGLRRPHRGWKRVSGTEVEQSG